MGLSAVDGQEMASVASFAVELSRLLLNIEGLSGVKQILGLYLSHFDAFGAALWEVAEGVGTDRKGRLFIQAQCFEGLKQPPFYQLTMESVSGRCIRDGTAARYCK